MIYIQVLPLYYMRNQNQNKKTGEDGMYFSTSFQWLVNNLSKQELSN